MQLSEMLRPSAARSAIDDAVRSVARPRRFAEAVLDRVRPGSDDLETDDWGRDEGAVRAARRAAAWRWDIHLGDATRLPKAKGALVVVNTRHLTFHPMLAALALSEASGRPVRFAGRGDATPGGRLTQRIGGLLKRPDEIRTALRGDQIVVIGAEPTLDPWKIGTVDYHLVEPAIRENVPIHAAAVITFPLRRTARIELTRPIPVNRGHRGPLAEIELSLAIERRLAGLMSEVGGTRTKTPLDWFGTAGLGGG